MTLRPASGVVLLLVACAGGPRVDVTRDPPDRLSRMHLLDYADGAFTYADGVLPYDLNTPLFSDHALKDRAVWIPEGEAATFDREDAFDLPVGTVLIKSFSYAPDLREPTVDPRVIETRLLIHADAGWEAWPYVWDDDQRDAELVVGGRGFDVDVIDEVGTRQTFEYRVPQKNQCEQCHLLFDDAGDTFLTPIGIKARHLNRDGADLLDALVAAGQLTDVPADVPAATSWAEVAAVGVDALGAELEPATRDWLDINCAHCHNPRGVSGVTSQLFLDHGNTDAFHLGVCKLPGSAGLGGADRTYDIVPGDHAASILWYRMSTTEVGAMMPQLGRATELVLASDLVAAWIDGMEGGCD